MDQFFLYKTKIPKGIYSYPLFLLLTALAFLYYDVPLLTSYFYLVITGILLYIIYINRNPLPSIIFVYTDRIKISQPFRLKKDLVFFYKDIHGEFVFNVYKIDSMFVWKRYVVNCSFIFGEDARALSFNLSPDLTEFSIALSIIRHKLKLYRKSIRDTLNTGSEETGPHLVNQFEREGLTKEEIINLYVGEDISEEIAEKHFAELEKIKDHEIHELKKDYSAAGYLLLAVGILLILISIILRNGRFIIWAFFAFIIGINIILKSGKTKKVIFTFRCRDFSRI